MSADPEAADAVPIHPDWILNHVKRIGMLDGKKDTPGEEVLEARRAEWKPRETDYTSGVIWKFAQTVGSALNGAVTHPGGKAEKNCYADV